MAEPQHLKVEADECITLSPESARFKDAYKQVRPRSADEVRELIGPAPWAAKALREKGSCCGDDARIASSVPADDLTHEDPETRARARSLTYKAFEAYAKSADHSKLAHMVPTLDRYLDISKATLNIAALMDIEVADGATLTISPSTHVLTARKIIIHPTGRIVCSRSLKIKAQSVEGVRPHLAKAPSGAFSKKVMTGA